MTEIHLDADEWKAILDSVLVNSKCYPLNDEMRAYLESIALKIEVALQ